MDSLFYNLGYDIKGIDDTSTMDSDKNIANNIQESKLLYLEAMLDQNQNDPLLTSIAANTFKKSTHLQIKDLYSFNLNSSSLALQTENKVDARVLQTLERALIYAGCPSLVISNGTENNHVSFWEYFFENLLDYPAAEALTRAQKSMRDAGFKPASYAFYQVVGFEGMTESQENQFARDRFRTMVALGNRYYEQKKWEDALNSYEQAVVMAARQGDQNAIENLYELILYSAANGGLWGKAINYQLKIVQQAIENRDAQKMIEEYRYLIYFYTQNKNYEKAIQYQKEYLDLTEKYNLTDETADSYHRLGLVLEQSGEFRQAADQFSRAINEYRELGDSLKVAECLKDRGRIYLLTLDNYSGAITDQHAALKIFQEFGNIEKSLEVLQNLGLSHERLANYQEALKLQMQGIELANTINSPTWIALSKQHLANVNWKTGNYQQALKFQKEALETFKKLNNLKFQEIGLSTYGLILFSLGQIEKGLEYEQEALVLAKRIQDYQDIATVHKNISLIYRSTGQWENALEHIKLAIDMDNKVGSERGLSYDFRDLGIIYRHQGKTGEAFNNFRLGLALSKKIKDGRNLAQSYYEIGKTHFSQNNLSSASDSLKLAINLAEDLFVPEVKWRALRILGQIYVEQNEYENALHPFLTALETIEKMRSRIKIEEYKSGFIDDKLEIYHDLINVYLKLKMPDKALEIVERAKSRNFVDLLANKNIKFSGDFSQQDFSKSKNIRGKINRVQNEISRLIIKGEEATDAENQMLEQLRQELSILKNQYQDLLLKLKEQNPELASMVTVEAKSIDYFQSALPDSVILLEYFYTKNQLFLWAVSNKSVTAKQEFISSDYLYSMVDTLRKSMVKQLPLKKIATELYQVLINPVQSEIEAFNHIVLIPHGILHYLPFASLINDNNKYLIENFSLSIASSATVFRLCLDKGEDFVNNDSWEPNILALGNPNLGNPEMELPFAEKEIESLQLTYSKVQSHLYNEASESRIKKAAADANLLLFSCHGEFDAVNPLFSALLLKSDEQNDGRLEAHEIFNLELKTYLVAMSACETGLAKIGVGDEVVGLSRSFIYAGSSSLLSSLWKVDDLATAVLVKRFFRYLKQGNSRAKALQRAVLFVKNNVNEHPLFWAAFNITGDFR
ncbi:hypothetical protein B6I21_03450 [candidate division KSB1 bacterium 4572_119]|nr:MAG: hypothetical protein B6I21_03450 [candidate division KSB1 bacterium 4572_119]